MSRLCTTSVTFLSALALCTTGAHAQPAKDPDALTAEGVRLIRRGDLKQAEEVMRDAAKARGNSIEALYDLARVKLASGDLKQAKAACRTLSEKDARSVLTHVCNARAFLLWRRASQARDDLELARTVDGSHPEVLLAVGELKRMSGENAASKEAYQQVLGLDPNNAEAHYGLGKLYVVMRELDAAKQAFTNAVARAPEWADALYELGKLEQGTPAIDAFEKALAIRPDWLDARLGLAEAKQQAGDLSGAETLLREILKTDAGNAAAHARLGMVLEAKRDYAGAEPELRLALAQLPNDPDANISLARVLAATDRVDDALAHYRVVAGLERLSARAFIEAGELALSLSRTSLAQAFLDKALEREPQAARALELQRKLQAAK